MAHLFTIFGMAGSSDTIRFGSLKFPMLPLDRMWAPPVFMPLQTFLFGSLDFVADQLGVLRLHEEALVPVSTRGGAPSTGPGPLDDHNVETLALRLEPMLGSNPTVSDVHIVLYSLFNTFRRLSGGTPLSPSRPPCDRFPYGFASPVDTCARGLQRMLTSPPLNPSSWGWRATLPPLSTTSWTMTLKAMAPASAMSWHLATLYPGSALWWMLRDSRRW